MQSSNNNNTDFDVLLAPGADDVTTSDVPADVAGDAVPVAPTMYEYLAAAGMLVKLSEVAMKKAAVPPHLRDEARQAVQVKWCLHTANTRYAPSQIYHYAALLGKDECLKVRREMGAVVVLPASMFERNGSENIKNSVFAQSIGAAVNPMSVDDVSDSAEYSVDESDALPERATPLHVRRRLAALTLTGTQRQIAEMICCNGLDIAAVTERMGLTRAYVDRLVTQITTALNMHDDELLAA